MTPTSEGDTKETDTVEPTRYVFDFAAHEIVKRPIVWLVAGLAFVFVALPLALVLTALPEIWSAIGRAGIAGLAALVVGVAGIAGSLIFIVSAQRSGFKARETSLELRQLVRLLHDVERKAALSPTGPTREVLNQTLLTILETPEWKHMARTLGLTEAQKGERP